MRRMTSCGPTAAKPDERARISNAMTASAASRAAEASQGWLPTYSSSLSSVRSSGAKKGAHYTRARLGSLTRQRTNLAAACAAAVAFAAVAAFGQGDARDTEAELAAIKAEIERVRAHVERDEIERNRLAKALRTAERSVGAARAELERIRQERAARTAHRAALAQERLRNDADLKRGQAALAGQMRAAYIVGREEPLRLLLNQQ